MESLLVVRIRTLEVYLGIFMFGASICSEAADSQDAKEPIWPTKQWQTSLPEEQGMDSKELAELVDFGASAFEPRQA